MTTPELIDGSELDYDSFVEHQKDSYRDLLKQSGVSDAFMTGEYYRWKYNPPAGYGRIAVIRDGDEIISSASMFPVIVRQNEIRIMAWQSLDVATRKEARGKGYFQACLKTLMDSLDDNEIFYAFPNKYSLPAFLNLGCVENLIVTTWFKPFNAGSRQILNNIEQVESFDANLDHLGDRIARSDSPALDRGAEYMNWRFTDHPNNQYDKFVYRDNDRIQGCAIIREAHAMGKTVALIMELWGINNTVIIRLFRKLSSWAYEKNLKLLILMDASLPFMEGISYGYLPVPALLLPKKQVQVVYATDGDAQELIKSKWRIQTGDWDVF